MSKEYIKKFDYLRAIAVLAVFFYHLASIYLPSGYLGVVIFFLFAGFLSMKAIVDRSEKSTIEDGFSKLKGKVGKLYPSMLVVIILVTIVMVIYFQNFLTVYPIDALSSVFSVNNYSQILRHESYFEAMNSIKPLTHLWALSLEFQFYIVFYLLVYPFYNKDNKNKYLIGFIVLTVLSFAYSTILSLGNADLTRIYYGLDTRLGAFLIGAIAAIKADDFLGAVKNSKSFIKFLKVFITIVMVAVMFVDFDTNAKTIGALNVYAILGSIQLLVLYSDDKLSDGKENIVDKISYEVVKRSYVIYLVHYPIIIFANRILAHTTVDMKFYFLIMIVAAFVASEIVYRLINLIFSKTGKKEVQNTILTIMFVGIIAASLFIKSKTEVGSEFKNDNYIASMSETYIEETFESETSGETKESESADYLDAVETVEKLEGVDGIYDADGRLLVTTEEYNSYPVQSAFQRIKMVNALVGGDATLTNEEFLEFRNMNITIIGDSVTQGSKGPLSIYFPNGIVDSQGNRQLRSALPVFYELKEKNQLGDIVVVALGTNSDKDIRVDVLEEIYQNIGDRPMIVLTVAIPYVIEEQKRNKALRDFANSHDNCHVADWHATMKTHSEYFIGDDTHPKGLGTDVYAQLIFKTAIASLEWRKIGNEWRYYGSGNEVKYAVELEKNIGDIVKYGTYYINSDTEKEPIEWVVVDKNEETKTEILLSKYVLDRKKYNDVYASTMWQKCEMRRWLNDEFYNEAFSDVGAKFMMVSAIDNHNNPNYKTLESSTTYDRVYLPSYNEINKYIKEDLRCKGTEYFKDKGGYVDEEGYADWWSRTAGDADNHTMNVSASGEIIMKGDYVTTDDIGIRPMIKVTYK